VAGWADTSTPDRNYPTSCLFCIFGPFILHAFQWKEGELNDLGALPGLNSSAAFFVSDSGLSAGFSENGAIDPLLNVPEIHAVLWKNDPVIDLGTLKAATKAWHLPLIAGASGRSQPEPDP
jgi:hypothetical protein